MACSSAPWATYNIQPESFGVAKYQQFFVIPLTTFLCRAKDIGKFRPLVGLLVQKLACRSVSKQLVNGFSFTQAKEKLANLMNM